jgi:hypothetical protein
MIAALSGAAAHAQTVVPSTYVLPVSAAVTGAPGFIWNVSEVLNSEPNMLSWAELQLIGLEGQNFADPTQVGPAANGGNVADGPAQTANPNTAPISFTISGVINVSKAEGTTKGNFTPDDQMPGIPGTGGNNGTDNIAAEILTCLSLPAGTNTLGVNSDDGFRMTIGGGAPGDKFAVNVGQFDGGRGAADTIFQIVVPQAGLYAARVLYENGGGDANIEWFSVNNGTNKVLINDIANGGIPAYRAVTTTHAIVSAVDPGISQYAVSPNEGVHVSITDGATPISGGSIALILDGAAVSPTIAKSGAVTKVDFNPPSPWGPKSAHTASIQFTDGSLKVTNSWSFTVQPYISLDPSWAVTNVDTSKPGFNWNIYANSDSGNTVNSNERAERDLTLQGVDANGLALPNLASPTAVGAAVGAGTASASANGPVHFEIASTINLDIANNNMPGAPSSDGSTDGQAAEVLTYLNLPAGVIHMRIDSDDGWRLYAGSNPSDLFGRAVVAEHNDGTGPVDFAFYVPTAGAYPFRLIWENGTGGSHLIWSYFKTPQAPVLVNDTANGGIAAFRAVKAGAAANPAIVAATPVPAIHQMERSNTNITVVLLDGANAITDGSVALTVDGKSVSVSKSRSGPYLTITDNGSAFSGLQLPSEIHSATLTYSAAGGYTRTQSWNFDNIQVMILPTTPVASENFDSYPEATSVANTVPPGWTAWNYTVVNTPGWDLTDKSSDAYRNWIVISADTMNTIEGGTATFDMNQTINGVPDSQLFSGNVLWATSDGRNNTQAQFCTSAPFNLSSVNNPVLTYSSIIRMSNGGNAQCDGIEYSIDGGKTWLPGIIYQTIAYGTEGNVILDQAGNIDAVATMTVPNSVVAYWTDPSTGKTVGGNDAAALAEPVTPDLNQYIAPRSNQQATSARVDGIRLPLAAHKSDVRLRFFQIGNCSWWWGVDNLAFYDVPSQVVSTPPHIDSIQITGGNLSVKWSNGGTLQSSPSLSNQVWTSTGNSSGTYTTAAPTSGTLFFRVKN